VTPACTVTGTIVLRHQNVSLRGPVGLPFDPRKSFHEKVGRCQGALSLSSFRESVPIQPSRLCRHPSIRTLL
jgi:hypothetical protein